MTNANDEPVKGLMNTEFQCKRLFKKRHFVVYQGELIKYFSISY